MEVFNLLNNTLIKKIDATAVDPVMPKPLKNTLKTFVKLGTITRTTGSIYNQKLSIPIGREYDGLSMLYIKNTVANGGNADTPSNMFGTKIYKKIRLTTRRGTTLQEITPTYSQLRIGQLKGSQLYEKLEDSVKIKGSFTTGADPTVITPLFLFCSEDTTTFLSTRLYENLTLELETNTGTFEMGLSELLTFLKIELYGLFFDTNTSSSITDQLNTVKPGVPRQIMGSFNIFYEDDISIVNGQTSAKLLLRCPHPTFCLQAQITDNQDANLQISRVVMTFANRVFLDLDYTMNYQFFGSQQGFIPANGFSYFFSKEKKRHVDSGLITFSKQMSPCIIEYFFVSNGDYTIKTMCEYRTNYKVDDTGFISLSDDVLPGEGQNQSNSFGLYKAF